MPGRLIGYARVSTDDQRLELQTEALTKAGVEPNNIHTDTKSGVSVRRPGLGAAMKDLVAGDTLVVWKLDRLGRSLIDLLNHLTELERRGIGFRSLTESIDTKEPVGRLLLAVLGAVAQFERDLISERTRAGMQVLRDRGVKLGPKRVIDRERVIKLHRAGYTLDEIAKQFPGSRGREHASRQAIYGIVKGAPRGTRRAKK